MFFEENILEPVARWFRLRAVWPFYSHSQLDVVDFGCGPSAPFYRHTSKQVFRTYVGIDPLTKSKRLADNAVVKQAKIEATKLPANSADRVVMLAVLEHVDEPLPILKEAFRILKPGGLITLTTPTPAAKNILEVLSFKLHLLSPREIEEHKRYLTPEETRKLLLQAGFSDPHVVRFELGWNQLGYAKKV